MIEKMGLANALNCIHCLLCRYFDEEGFENAAMRCYRCGGSGHKVRCLHLCPQPVLTVQTAQGCFMNTFTARLSENPADTPIPWCDCLLCRI
jgi:hypothetical protein